MIHRKHYHMYNDTYKSSINYMVNKYNIGFRCCCYCRWTRYWKGRRIGQFDMHVWRKRVGMEVQHTKFFTSPFLFSTIFLCWFILMNGLQGNYRWKENIVRNFLHRLHLFMVNKSTQRINRFKDDAFVYVA